MDDNQCIDTSKDSQGHFGHFDVKEPLSQEAFEPRLLKVLRLMETNGSDLRSIISAISTNKPFIMSPLTHPKKGKAQHKIAKESGESAYFHNDIFSMAYILLNKSAIQSNKDVCFITATFDDETNRKLRTLNASPNAKETMIRKVQRWLRAFPYIKDAIFVLEECHNGKKVVVGKQSFNRLHVHLLTVLSKDEQAQAKKELFRKKIVCGVTLKTSWTAKRPHTELDEIEEEQFGPIPRGAIDPNAAHWLNTYVAYEKGEKKVCIVLPGCLRAADYMTKSLDCPIGQGSNFATIGLKGRRQLQEELSKKGTAILKELQDL
nr:hypothetical protein [uncultured Vibrio sp.]